MFVLRPYFYELSLNVNHVTFLRNHTYLDDKTGTSAKSIRVVVHLNLNCECLREISTNFGVVEA